MENNKKYLEAKNDVLGIGNAIVDVLAQVKEEFLATNGIPKGTMDLVDEARAEHLFSLMSETHLESGGSAANTIVGLASIGSPCSFIGKVCNDILGGHFRDGLDEMGVSFESLNLENGPSTARCMIFVTPDADRSMNTFLGACTQLSPDDIDEETVKNAKVTYLEGYLWDPDLAKEAFRKAIRLAAANDRHVALSLSDPFCVGRHREEFLDLAHNHVDILFANEDEIKSLYQVDTFAAAAQILKEKGLLTCVTRGAEGCVILSKGEELVVPAAKVSKVVDTTGAGDLFAAGFLYGYCRDLNLKVCAQMGGIAAAEIISHYGARPEVSLKELFAAENLL